VVKVIIVDALCVWSPLSFKWWMSFFICNANIAANSFLGFDPYFGVDACRIFVA